MFINLQVLHSGSTNKNAYKVRIVAEYTGVDVQLVKSFEMGVSNKTPEFIKMNPIGKVESFDIYRLLHSIRFLCLVFLKSLFLCRFLFSRHRMVLYLRVTPLHAMVRLPFKLTLIFLQVDSLRIF